jgi:predicted nucleotidyltransferase
MLLDQEKIADFCGRWHIIEFAVFGSVLREDFRPDSDIDCLVTFDPDAKWTLLDHVRMERQLSELLARPVDLVSKRAIERSSNYLRRRAILESAEVLYAA